MILTTTPTVEGKQISSYLGIVFGEVITGTNFIKDIGAGFTNFFGGRSGGYETDLTNARDEALREIESRAKALGADGVVGLKMDYEAMGTDGTMLMVTCSGTAVKFQD